MAEKKYFTERYLRLADGTFPHMGVSGGDVAPVVLLCGNPERTERIRECLDAPEAVGQKRGYLVYTGSYKGQPVTAASSGLGSPSVAIAVEELAAAGGDAFLRVGSCASCQPDLRIGDLVVATGAVRDEGTSPYYAPPIYPAVADFDIVTALCRSAEELGSDYRLGLVRSTDSFYEGERQEEIIQRWGSRGVLAFEMESSALFTVATVLGYRAGSILVPGTNLHTGEATYQGVELDRYWAGMGRAIDIALDAAVALGLGADRPSD